jgi:hypothetical protein
VAAKSRLKALPRRARMRLDRRAGMKPDCISAIRCEN